MAPLSKEVLLGLPGAWIDATDAVGENEVYETRVGAAPVWPEGLCPAPDAIDCGKCKSPMSLVLQAYAPLSASETGHAALPQRWLFVFGCARKNCGLDPASWKVLRVQAPPLEPAQTPHAGQAVTVAAAETPPARCGAEGGAVQGRDGHGVVGGEVPGVPVDTLGWGEAVASFSGDAGAGWGDEASTQGGQYAWGDGAGWGNGGQENNSASGSADWGTSKGHGGGGEGAASVAGGTAASWQQGAMPFQVDMTASSSQPTWAAARENNSGDNDEGSAGDNAGAGGPLDELSELARALSQACTSAVVDHEAAGRATAKSKNKARRAAKEAVPAHMRDDPWRGPLLPAFYIMATNEGSSSGGSQRGRQGGGDSPGTSQHVRELLGEYERGLGTGASVLAHAGDEEDGGAGAAGAGWTSEGYEYDSTPLVGRTYFKFQKKLRESPEQCVRYSFNGPALWANDPALAPGTRPGAQGKKASQGKAASTDGTGRSGGNAPSSSWEPPPCPGCQGPRVFEMQLMSPLLYFLSEALGSSGDKGAVSEEGDAAHRGDGASASEGRPTQPNIAAWVWDTLLVFSCKQSCFKHATANVKEEPQSMAMIEEFCTIQQDFC